LLAEVAEPGEHDADRGASPKAGASAGTGIAGTRGSGGRPDGPLFTLV